MPARILTISAHQTRQDLTPSRYELFRAFSAGARAIIGPVIPMGCTQDEIFDVGAEKAFGVAALRGAPGEDVKLDVVHTNTAP